jgi:hypothetical protein
MNDELASCGFPPLRPRSPTPRVEAVPRRMECAPSKLPGCLPLNDSEVDSRLFHDPFEALAQTVFSSRSLIPKVWTKGTFGAELRKIIQVLNDMKMHWHDRLLASFLRDLHDHSLLGEEPDKERRVQRRQGTLRADLIQIGESRVVMSESERASFSLQFFNH